MKKNKFKILGLLLIIFMSLLAFSPEVLALEYDKIFIAAQEIGAKGYTVCSDSNFLKAFRAFGYVLIIVKIIVPLLIIVFGCVDLGKAVISSDSKAINTATNSLVKRAVAGVIIFFIPTIIDVVFDLVNGAEDVKSVNSYCQECLINPNGDVCTNNTNN